MHKVLTLHIIHIYRHVLNSQAYSLCLLARPISHKIKCMSVNGRTLTRPNLLNPSIFDDFFKPWNELGDSRWPYIGQAPAVNIKETDKDYEIIMAAPG